MDFKQIYEANEDVNYSLEGFKLKDGDDIETSKENFVALLRHVSHCLGEAAEYGKAISYFQEKSPVDHEEGYEGEDGEWIEVPYTDEEKEKLDDYNKKSKEYHDKRDSQEAGRLDYDIYEIREKVDNLLEKAKKIED